MSYLYVSDVMYENGTYSLFTRPIHCVLTMCHVLTQSEGVTYLFGIITAFRM